MDSNSRIPISEGFHIYFSKDGRALSRGLEESLVLPSVLFWLRTHKGKENYLSVEKWVGQKTKQLEAETLRQQRHTTRAEINRSVDRAARESVLHDKELTELVRTEIFRLRGISEFED